jgi:P4 family phage/plasmid primase-like protien
MADKKILVDLKEAERALNQVVEPGQTFEIRILTPVKNPHGWNPRVIYGYFDCVDAALKALSSLHLAGAKGFYVTLNPVAPSLLARSYNRLTEAKDNHTTADKDISARRWLLIDCDPKRPAGISASDDEKELAHQKAQEVYKALKADGWPEPLVADSGNGFHLMYRIDLPADDGGLVKRCLAALDDRFSDAQVSIDTTVYNPARIVKLYGSLAAKGGDCPEIGREHRMSRMLTVPNELQAVPNDNLEALGVDKQSTTPPLSAPPKTTGSASSSRKGTWNKDRMQQFIDDYLSHCSPQAAQPYEGGWKWVLGTCPFDEAHNDRSAVIVIKADGKLGFKCHHDGCKGNNWKALRAKYEPSAQQKTSSVLQTDVGLGALEERYGPPIMFNSKGDPSDVNQMFIAAKFAADNLVLFEPRLGLFYCYDESKGLWLTKTESTLLLAFGHCFSALLNQLSASSLLKKRSKTLLAHLVSLLKGEVEHPDIFTGQRKIIHVENGVLHLDDDPVSFHEFSPDYYSRNRSEIAFDESAECPRFLNELLRPALCDEDISLLQRYAGQCLLGCNPAQKILLLRGTPGGGKSTLADVLERVIGTHNVVQLRVQHLADRFEIASYVGKTLLCGKDVPGNFLNNKSAHVLKALVGGDRLNAEEKNVKHRFELIGDFNVLITSNSRLHVKLDSDAGAWRRRLLIIDYEQPPTGKPIPYFAQKLVEQEGSGILNWCIEGAVQLLAELDAFGTLRLDDAQKDRVEALLSESDSVRYFVNKCTVNAPGADVTVNEMMTLYNDFCEEQGWQALSTKQFQSQISDVMMEIHRAPKRTDIKRDGKNQRGFSNVELVEPEL